MPQRMNFSFHPSYYSFRFLLPFMVGSFIRATNPLTEKNQLYNKRQSEDSERHIRSKETSDWIVFAVLNHCILFSRIMHRFQVTVSYQYRQHLPSVYNFLVRNVVFVVKHELFSNLCEYRLLCLLCIYICCILDIFYNVPSILHSIGIRAINHRAIKIISRKTPWLHTSYYHKINTTLTL